jgi:hypothetical protein
MLNVQEIHVDSWLLLAARVAVEMALAVWRQRRGQSGSTATRQTRKHRRRGRKNNMVG